MSVIQIEYDLRRDKDYASVEKAIKSLGPWCHMLKSSWLVKGVAFDRVHAVMAAAFDADDLWVVHPFVRPANGRLSQEIWDWINTAN